MASSNESLIYMGSELYKAASEGKIEVFENMEVQEILNLLTPNKNTILHIYITASKVDKPEFVKKVLRKCPGLLLQTNVKGETLLHMAARFGHKSISGALIEQAKSHGNVSSESPMEAVKRMVRIANEGQDTALHEAVRFGHPGVAEMLIDEDGDYLLNCVNKVGESPLYIAARRGRCVLVSKILEKCSTPPIIGPCGRTALHASTIAGDETSTKKIVEKMAELTRKGDSHNRIPLHYAAAYRNHAIAKLLLKVDKDSAYIKDIEGKTALHIAAANGDHRMMKEIMLACPGCCEMVDDNGCNVLHFAAEHNDKKTAELILKDPSLSNLLYQRNRDGNTPLHHCAFSKSDIALKVLLNNPREDKMAINDENKNACDILYTNRVDPMTFRQFRYTKWLLKENGIIPDGRVENDIEGAFPENLTKESEDLLRSNIEKSMDTGMIVAALIATVAFTASFTVPGGYISDQGGSLAGSPILAKKTAFQAFIVSNTLALLLSSLAIFLHMLVRQDIVHGGHDVEAVVSLLMTAVSMMAMIIAFITGSYVVLSHHHSLVIATCTIGSSFFLFCVIMLMYKFRLVSFLRR